MGIPDNIDKHHQVWEEVESEIPWEKEREYMTRKEIQGWMPKKYTENNGRELSGGKVPYLSFSRRIKATAEWVAYSKITPG